MRKKQKPIPEVQLEQKNVKLRIVLLVICLIIAFVSIGAGISMLVNKQAGWQKVEITANATNCSSEFTLHYCFGQGEMSVSEEYRNVSRLYSQACEEGYRYFYKDSELARINAAPNQNVTVSQPLYRALEQIVQANSRYVYLAPVYVEYNRVFLCETEAEASRYDPLAAPEQAKWLQELASYCADPQMIQLELLGENTVKLSVSGQYLAFAQEYEITEFLDFGWMRNAFIADHIADTLLSAGYTRGYTASYDGFTRNLDSGNYTLNAFHREGAEVQLPAAISYNGPASVVVLRDYPMSAADRWHYFTFSDGHTVTAMVSPQDGGNHSALSELVAYSAEQSCAEMVLQLAPVYLCDTLDQSALLVLAEQGIHSVWYENIQLLHTQKDLTVTLNPEAEMPYQIQFVQ